MPATSSSARRRRPAGARRPTFLAVAALAAGLAVAGCTAPGSQHHGPSIQLSSAQVTLPTTSGLTDVYVDVENKGPADKIVSASLDTGGTVTLRSPVRAGATVMRTVPSIAVPADSSLGLDPNGAHLLVTGTGHMVAGHQITLTVVFAHAGALSVPAMVTDPESGGSSYFLN